VFLPVLCSEIPWTTVARSDQMEPSEQIEQLNGAICSLLESTKQLRSKIRNECVPTNVCTYLRHCIKENDVWTFASRIANIFTTVVCFHYAF